MAMEPWHPLIPKNVALKFPRPHFKHPDFALPSIFRYKVISAHCVMQLKENTCVFLKIRVKLQVSFVGVGRALDEKGPLCVCVCVLRMACGGFLLEVFLCEKNTPEQSN